MTTANNNNNNTSPDLPYVSVERSNITGHYVVHLDGVVYDNCTRDSDCPGASVCYRRASWSAFDSQCACNVVEHLWGWECRERWTLPLGKFLLATWIVMLVIYVGCVLVSLATLYLTFRVERSLKQAISGPQPLVLNAALVFLSAACGMTTVILFLAPHNVRYNADGLESLRSATTVSALNILSIPHAVFLTAVMLSVSMTWLIVASTGMNLAERAGRGGVQGFVRRYKIIRLAIYLSVLGSLLVLILAGRHTHLTRIVSVMFFSILIDYAIATYWVGYFWLGRYIKGIMLPSRHDQLKENIEILSRAAWALTILCAILTVLSVVAVAAGIQNIAPTPFEDPRLVITQIYSLISTFLLVVLSWYLFAIIRLKRTWKERKIRAEATLRSMFETTTKTRSRAVSDSED